jgi:hypothetical protein
MFAALTPRLSRWNVAVAIYAVVSIVALAGLLFTPGTVGHHWDWLIPSDPAELRRFAAIEGSSWQDYDFGSYVTYRYATVLTSLLFGLPGYAGLGGAFVTKALVLASVFVSGLAMRYLLLSLVADEPDERDGVVATFGGLLYALAPYAYNQIVAGDQSALIADALSPLAIGYAVRSISARERLWLAYALASSLLLGIIVASVQVFLFTVGVMWAVCLAIQWSRVTLVRLGVLTAVAIALCAFWVLPALVAGGAVRTVVQTSPIDTAIATFGQFSNPWLTLTMLAFPGDFALHALDKGAPLFFAAYGALVALCAVALVKCRSRLLVVLGGIFVLTAIVPLGGNPFVGPVVIAIFRLALPYSLILRTPQHLMFIMSLVVPMMVYLSARVIPRRFYAVSLASAAIVVVAYGQGFFVHSGFFGLIGPFGETQGERATVAFAEKPANDGYRTMFVPNEPSFYFHPGIFDYYFEGSDDPQIRFLPGMTMGAGQKWTPYDRTQQLVKALDEFVPDGSDRATQAMLLRMAGVKHLVVHNIGVPTAGIRLAGQNDRSYLESAMRRTGLATLERSLADRSIWRFNRPVRRAYAPDCIFGVPPRADPYDVLVLAPAAASCASPAAISTNVAGARSEYVISPETFRAVRSPGIPISLALANVETELVDRGRGFYAVVPPRGQDVEILEMPVVPAGTTGISFRIYSDAPRRVYVQLYSPDELNFLQASVDLSGPVQDVALNFQEFGSVGAPDVRRFRFLRFASTNTGGRDVQMFAGAFRWLDSTGQTTLPQYLSVAGNRWDKFYFGGDRPHVLFKPAAGIGPVYATAVVERDGTYDVVARVQDVNRELSLRASVDGRTSRCSTTGSRVDETERLVRLLRLPLRRGPHTLALQYCGNAPAGTADVGVQSIVLASAKFEPPAFRAAGSVRVLDERPGTMRFRADGNYLVFTDSFDDRWIASQGGVALQHVLANGYANAWRIPNPGAGDVTLEFWPQRSFEFGIAVSLGLAAICLVTIALTIFEKTEAAGKRGTTMERVSQG